MTTVDTYLVQVKRRADLSRNEGVTVVRELNGVLFREGLAKGIVITTAKGYTAAALKERNIKTEASEAYEVQLRAFDDVVAMLRLPSVTPYRPWREHMPDVEDAGYTIISETW